MKFPFNKCDPASNGELWFYNQIKNTSNVIFDVGCRHDSLFLDFEGDVHYFEPVSVFLQQLQQKNNKNTVSKFNNYGLGLKEETLTYYSDYQSFFDRTVSCNTKSTSTLKLQVKRARDYMMANNIGSIDLLKIDTEGFEYNVLKGFGEFLDNIKIIQFEYGGTYLDSGVKLQEIFEYLRGYGFHNFAYLSQGQLIRLVDCIDIPINPQAYSHTTKRYTSGLEDHYNYCNIVCFNSNRST